LLALLKIQQSRERARSPRKVDLLRKMHAGKAVADLREVFAKKEEEIRELKKQVEVGKERCQSVHGSIQRQREQIEIYRSDLASLTARISGLAQRVQTIAREEAEEVQLIEGQVATLRALETKLQDITNKQTKYNLKVINTYTEMNMQQQHERSQCNARLGIPVMSEMEDTDN
jgi:chromosome segregation ATPase